MTGLHTEEVQRLWNLVKDELKPNQLLDVAIGALTELSREGTAAIRLAVVRGQP